MLLTVGELAEFRVLFNRNQGSVTLIYGERKKRGTRRKKPSAPGAIQGRPKPAAKLPATDPISDTAPSPDKSARSDARAGEGTKTGG